MTNGCQIPVITEPSIILQFAVQRVVEEEEVVNRERKRKKQMSLNGNMAVCDSGQHYPVEISTPHNGCTKLKCTALKYSKGRMQFGTHYVSEHSLHSHKIRQCFHTVDNYIYYFK